MRWLVDPLAFIGCCAILWLAGCLIFGLIADQFNKGSHR